MLITYIYFLFKFCPVVLMLYRAGPAHFTLLHLITLIMVDEYRSCAVFLQPPVTYSLFGSDIIPQHPVLEHAQNIFFLLK
jgi:hypothetical protein